MCEKNLEPELNNPTIEELEKHLLWQVERYAPYIGGRQCVTPKEKLKYLRHFCVNMRQEMANLELSWDQCTLILHEGTLLYYERVEGAATRKIVRDNSSRFIKSVVHLSQSGKLRNGMRNLFEQQIKDVDEVIRVKYPDLESADQ